MPKFLSNFSSRQSNDAPTGLQYTVPPAGLQNSERRSLRLPPQSGNTFKFNGNNTIRFVIPGQGFLMNDHVRLKFRLGVVRPGGNAADTCGYEGWIPSAKCLFSRIRVLSNSDQRVLEDINAYDVVSRQLEVATRAVGSQGDSAEVPFVVQDNFDRYFQSVSTAVAYGYLAVDVANESNVGVECYFDFDFVGLKSSAYWPLFATSGLVLELVLNTPNQVLCRKNRQFQWDTDGTVADLATLLPANSFWVNQSLLGDPLAPVDQRPYTIAAGMYYVINNPTLLYDILLPPSSYLNDFEQKLTSDGIQIAYVTIDNHLFLNNAATEELFIGQKLSSIRGLMVVQRSNPLVESTLGEHLRLGHSQGKNSSDPIVPSFMPNESKDKCWDGGKQLSSDFFNLNTFQVRIGSEMVPVQPMEVQVHGTGINITRSALEFYTEMLDFMDLHVVPVPRGGLNYRQNFIRTPDFDDITAVYDHQWRLNDAGTTYATRGHCGFVIGLDLSVTKDVLSGENTLATQSDMSLRIQRSAAPGVTLREDVFVWSDNIAIIRPGMVERLI